MCCVLFTQTTTNNFHLKELCVCKNTSELIEGLKEVLVFHVTGNGNIDIAKEYGKNAITEYEEKLAEIDKYKNMNDKELINFISNYSATILGTKIEVIGLYCGTEELNRFISEILPTELENLEREEKWDALRILRNNPNNYETLKEGIAIINELLCKS